MRDSPCHHCTKHSEICHAHCPDYPAWVAELAEERRAERAAADADAHAMAAIVRREKRARPKRRRGQR